MNLQNATIETLTAYSDDTFEASILIGKDNYYLRGDIDGLIVNNTQYEGDWDTPADAELSVEIDGLSEYDWEDHEGKSFSGGMSKRLIEKLESEVISYIEGNSEDFIN